MIPLIVIGCIILFFVFLFTVHAYITIEYKDDMKLSVKILGIKINILPKKEKKYKFSHYTLKKIKKRDEKLAKKDAKAEAAKRKKAEEKAKRKAEAKAERSKLTKAQKKAQKAKKKSERPKLSDITSLSLRVAKLFFSKFFGKLHIKVARLNIKVGSADAATTAIMYAALYPTAHLFMAGLSKISNVDGMDKAELSITPDYLSENIEFDLMLTFRVNLGGVLGAVFKAAFSMLFGWVKIQPSDEEKQARLSKTHLGNIPLPASPQTPPSPFAKKKRSKEKPNDENTAPNNEAQPDKGQNIE